MKKYTLQIVIVEGSDEWWDGLDETYSTGVGEVLEAVRDAFTHHVPEFDAEIRMVKFEDTP